MAIWRAKITEVSNIDSSARQEVAFNIIRPNGQTLIIGGQIVTLRTAGNPINIRSHIAQVASDFIQQVIEAAKLKVDDMIDMDI